MKSGEPLTRIVAGTLAFGIGSLMACGSKTKPLPSPTPSVTAEACATGQLLTAAERLPEDAKGSVRGVMMRNIGQCATVYSANALGDVTEYSLLTGKDFILRCIPAKYGYIEVLVPGQPKDPAAGNDTIVLDLNLAEKWRKDGTIDDVPTCFEPITGELPGNPQEGDTPPTLSPDQL